ncbi:Hypothetical protein NTJ_03909 [Nesidiocoris tenuis]|uniref:Uncharacterized protein n=1 Tax=Nesidiocoris tenuis TaxID=355587 RepID=A0ABN7AFP5_9HEMI|nr:Hypothetical protein NTJ_03909 [Nesidiocoris tenuis]
MSRMSVPPRRVTEVGRNSNRIIENSNRCDRLRVLYVFPAAAASHVECVEKQYATDWRTAVATIGAVAGRRCSAGRLASTIPPDLSPGG